MTPLELFDSFVGPAYVINLDRRPDRYAAFQKRISTYLPVERVTRIEGVDGQKVPLQKNWVEQLGHYGCYLSFMRAFDAAIADGRPTCLIFEDDVCFRGDWIAALHRGYQELPEEWLTVNLGPRVNTANVVIPGTPNLVQCRQAFANHAVLYNVKRLAWLKNEIKLEVEASGRNMDRALKVMQSKFIAQYGVAKGFYALPYNYAGQSAGQSDTHEDRQFTKDMYWDAKPRILQRASLRARD